MKKVLIQVIIVTIIILLVFLIFEDFEGYFTGLLDSVIANKLEYSLASSSLLIADVLLPVPSSLIMYSNGLVLGVFYGFTLSYSSLLVGSIFGYTLGRFATKRLGFISTKALGIFNKYGYLAIFLTRGIPILAESVSVVCGYNKVGMKHYILLNIIGYLPVCLVYSIFGSMGDETKGFIISLVFSICISIAFSFFGENLVKVDFNNFDTKSNEL